MHTCMQSREEFEPLRGQAGGQRDEKEGIHPSPEVCSVSYDEHLIIHVKSCVEGLYI